MVSVSHWTDWVALASGVVGTVATTVAAVQASNTSRMKATLDMAMPFVRALALSLDKPELLAAFESESTAAKDILRKQKRRKQVAAGAAFALTVVGVGVIFIPPPAPRGIQFSVGDAAQRECNDYGLGSVSHTTCTNRWFLDSSERKIQARATLEGPARETDLDIVVDGCSGHAQVRWELLADDESLGNGMAGSKQILDVPADKSSFTIRAERIDDDPCSAELVVKAVVWH